MSEAQPSISKYVPRFFTSERALARHFRERAIKMRFHGKGKSAALAWQAKARRKFAELLGLQHFKRCPAKPQKVGEATIDGLLREEWRIQSERDVWIPFYLFVPRGAAGKLPLVLCPHGHGSSGKWSPGGRHDIPEMTDALNKYNYDYGVKIAQAGFITACPDARGFGERREPNRQNDRANPALMFSSSCHELTLAGAPLGLTVQGMWTWDLMRLIDHLSKDRRIDAKRIGSAGLSGGGLQTLDVAAIDTRIKAAVDSGYFYGVRESLQIKNGNCMCNMVPGLWEHFDMGDLGALIAPRGLLIETGDADGLNGKSNLANVRSQTAITRNAYKQFGAARQFEQVVFQGGHRWEGTRAIAWLKEQLT